MQRPEAHSDLTQNFESLFFIIMEKSSILTCFPKSNAVNLVSFLPPEARPAQPERIAWGALGMFGAAMLHGLAAQTSRPNAAPASRSFLIRIATAEALVWLVSGLLLLYNALDRLQVAGLAAIASPIMVASCLVGFVIYGAIALRERPNRHQWLGLLCSLGGIALLAVT